MEVGEEDMEVQEETVLPLLAQCRTRLLTEFQDGPQVFFKKWTLALLIAPLYR